MICALLVTRREADPDDAVLADAQAPVLAALGDDGRGQRRRRGEEREARDAGGAGGRERRERVLSRLRHKVDGRDLQVLGRRQRGRGPACSPVILVVSSLNLFCQQK